MSLLLTQGNALRIPLADESVHCVVTSPPYYSLRDYGIPGQLGMEASLEEYVENMVLVFREVKRVLRHDGVVFLNLGDSYAGSGGAGGDYNEGGLKEGQPRYKGTASKSSLKPKDLMGVPWAVAFALRADGWWLRSDIIWSKPNPMPESVTDRPTKAHEYLFLLTKSAKYFYDADAVREAYDKPMNRWGGQKLVAKGHSTWDEATGQPTYRDRDMRPNPSGRNRRTVWHIATAPYSGAHFATYPPALVEPCIKAGTSERGVCPHCGAPWERVTEHEYKTYRKGGEWEKREQEGYGRSESMFKHGIANKEVTTLGWQPTCECKVMTCTTCDFVVEYPYANTKYKVRQLRSNIPVKEEKAEVLQSELLHKKRGVQGKRVSELRSDVHSEVAQGSPILRQDLCVSAHGTDKIDNEGMDKNDEGLYLHKESRTSQRDELRLRDGASSSDGEGVGETIGSERSSPSPERQEGRQPTRESSSSHDKQAQQHEAPKVYSDLPSLQAGVSSTGECPHCGSQLVLQPPQPKPAIILDPFCGSGTTLQVARALGRNGIGLDLSLEYLHLARQRLSLDALDAWGKAAKKDGATVIDLPMFRRR